jgi:hypothetical protein
MSELARLLKGNSAGTPKVTIGGTGEIKPPTPLGLFLGDVLSEVLPPNAGRFHQKRWLCYEMMVRLRKGNQFPANERRDFVYAILDQFGVPECRRDEMKRWLAARLLQMLAVFERLAAEKNILCGECRGEGKIVVADMVAPCVSCRGSGENIDA